LRRFNIYSKSREIPFLARKTLSEQEEELKLYAEKNPSELINSLMAKQLEKFRVQANPPDGELTKALKLKFGENKPLNAQQPTVLRPSRFFYLILLSATQITQDRKKGRLKKKFSKI
jgi:hypothetical protein